MKTLLSYPGIGTVIRIPIQAKMDVDNEEINCFHFGSSQESKLDPPLVLDSIWNCLGITLDTFVNMIVRPSWAGAVAIALFLAIMVVLDSSSTVMHLRLCHTL
jgi:hypothetical protein